MITFILLHLAQFSPTQASNALSHSNSVSLYTNTRLHLTCFGPVHPTPFVVPPTN